jgi:hypothetical protein
MPITDRVRLAFIALVISLLSTSQASAAVYRLDFTASGFAPTFGIESPPQTDVSGVILFEASSLSQYPSTILDVDLLIEGKSYSAGEVGGTLLNGAYQPYGVQLGYIFGGRLNGINVLSNNTDDFSLAICDHGCSESFTYSVLRTTTANPSEASYFWKTTDITYSISPVPEPATSSNIAAGLALLILIKARKPGTMRLGSSINHRVRSLGRQVHPRSVFSRVRSSLGGASTSGAVIINTAIKQAYFCGS